MDDLELEMAVDDLVAKLRARGLNAQRIRERLIEEVERAVDEIQEGIDAESER